jgi:GTPase SAR1 family protein
MGGGEQKECITCRAWFHPECNGQERFAVGTTPKCKQCKVAIMDTDTGSHKSLLKKIEDLASQLPPSMRDMFAPVFKGAKKKEQGFTVRMLGRAGSGKTALMSTLIHGARPEVDIDINSSKFDTSFIFERQTPFDLPGDHNGISFRRELTCLMTEAEQHERLDELAIKEADEGLVAAERRERLALQRNYPAPLSVQLDTLEAVQQDHVRIRSEHRHPGLISQYTVTGELGVAGVELVDCCGLDDAYMDNEGKLAEQLQESDMVLITVEFRRFDETVINIIEAVWDTPTHTYTYTHIRTRGHEVHAYTNMLVLVDMKLLQYLFRYLL